MKRLFAVLVLVLLALPAYAVDFDFKLSGYTMTNFNYINNNLSYGKGGTTDLRNTQEERDWIDNKFIFLPQLHFGQNFQLKAEVHLFDTSWGTMDNGFDGSIFSDEVHIEQIESDIIFPMGFSLRIGKFNNLLPWGPMFYFGPEPKPRIELNKTLGDSLLQVYYERTLEMGAVFQSNVYKNGSYDNKQGGGANGVVKLGSATLYPMLLLQHDSSFNGKGYVEGDKRNNFMARFALGVDWKYKGFLVQAGAVVANHTDNGAYAKYRSDGSYKSNNYTIPAGILEMSYSNSRFTFGLRGAYSGCAEIETNSADATGNSARLACGFNDMDVSAWNFVVGKSTGYDAMAMVSPYFGVNIIKGLRLDANIAYYVSTIPSSKYAMVAHNNPGRGVGMGITTGTVAEPVFAYDGVMSTDLARWTKDSSALAADIYLKYTWETVVTTVFAFGVSMANYTNLAYIDPSDPTTFSRYDPAFITAVQGKIHIFF